MHPVKKGQPSCRILEVPFHSAIYTRGYTMSQWSAGQLANFARVSGTLCRSILDTFPLASVSVLVVMETSSINYSQARFNKQDK